uniref:Uncharacterized protein n=1 Tax=Steinernema glaseri TaxID=37863 RepID=A0A1I7Z5F0_9BILA
MLYDMSPVLLECLAGQKADKNVPEMAGVVLLSSSSEFTTCTGWRVNTLNPRYAPQSQRWRRKSDFHWIFISYGISSC